MNVLIDYMKIKQVVIDASKMMVGKISQNNIFVKGIADFVTQTDLNIQTYIKKCLQELYPNIGFMGEEENGSTIVDGLQWILDPIDGTTNYIYNYNHSAISLALRDKTRIVFGMIYNPFTEEMFSAEQSKGAVLNDLPIHVNKTETLEKSLIAVGTSPYYKFISSDVFNKIEKVFNKALDIRRTGSAALDLAYVACGRQDAYFEYKLKPWDYAAGRIIIEEAGGVFRDIEKDDISYDTISDIIACSNEKLLYELLEMLH